MNTINIETVIIILTIHFVADFFFQTQHQALNKSKANIPLLKHCITYALPFIIISPIYALANGTLHFVTDYATSRLASKFWAEGKERRFFQTVGFDQLVHGVTLILTYNWLMN